MEMKESNVVILDIGMGNIHSVVKKVKRLGANPIITSSKSGVAGADKIIIPGVGHFGKAMKSLHQFNLIDELNHSVLERKAPVLGICLGLQLMAKHSEEGDTEGLGWIDADVVRFKIQDALRYKVPHTGWNQINIKKDSKLNEHISSGSEVYFVHAYHIMCHDAGIVLHESNYETNFVSAIQKENIFGVQYHPEKSHSTGEQLIQNFLNI